jgi:hypothetical protein
MLSAAGELTDFGVAHGFDKEVLDQVTDPSTRLLVHDGRVGYEHVSVKNALVSLTRLLNNLHSGGQGREPSEPAEPESGAKCSEKKADSRTVAKIMEKAKKGGRVSEAEFAKLSKKTRTPCWADNAAPSWKIGWEK